MTEQLPMPIPAPLSPAQTVQVLNLVRRAARAEILPRFRKVDLLEVATKSGIHDLVTAADLAAEAMITRGLQMAFPSALVIGEEAVEKDSSLRDRIAEAEMCFLIDPVDGTWNFANGIGTFGTMIAMTRFGRPVFSMIYDPLGDDAMIAAQEMPSYFMPATGRKRPIATAAPKSDFGEMDGYIPLKLLESDMQAKMAALFPELGRVGSLRCSAHEYRLLAQGGCDFVIGAKQTPWDHAPGVILCQQAGGYAAMLDGSDYSAALTEGCLLCASSKEVWEIVADKLSFLQGEPQGAADVSGESAAAS